MSGVPDIVRRLFARVRLIRFATVGAFCTGLSLTLNFIFLKIVGTPLIPTYVVVYSLTILLSFVLNSRYTFLTAVNLPNAARYFMIYVSAMGLGVLLLTFYRSIFDFQNWVYPFMSAPFTVLWNYTWSSHVLKKKLS
ncbi:MAG: GtrA family protein [Saprospiraceae bacterium]|nr:GtrA family protein [Saprospiraceae bacterium]